MVQKIRAQIRKDSPVKFVSHLDYAKVLERAIRRAELPIAFSEGFNPHMKISFGTVLPVGMTSETEFADFELTHSMEPQLFKEILNRQMPHGFRIIAAKDIPLSTPSLMAQLNLAKYMVVVEFTDYLTFDELKEKVNTFLALDSIWIEKTTKSKTRNTDIRAMIHAINVVGFAANVGELEMFLSIGNQGNLRPEQVLAAMQKYGFVEEYIINSLHRVELYQKADGLLRTPWEVI